MTDVEPASSLVTQHTHDINQPLTSVSAEHDKLVEVIQRTKHADIYRRCVDANAFTRTTDKNFPFDISEEKLRPIMDIFLEELKADKSSIDEDVAQFQVPEGFDFTAEVKAGTQRTISILHSAGLVDLKLIQGASRYVGPRNTHYTDGDLGYHFRATREYIEYKESIGLDIFSKFEMPYPERGRDNYFRLEIGGKGLKYKASQHVKTAASIGLKLTLEQALRFEALRGAAHEYGHAINRAASQQGISTQERSQSTHMLRSADKLDFVGAEIHDEHVARGIEDFVVRNYLRIELDWTQEQVDHFFEVDVGDRYFRSEAAYAFLDYAIQKGYTPNEIIKLQNAVILRAHTIYGDAIYLWDMADIISYHTQPYKEEELKTLFTRESFT